MSLEEAMEELVEADDAGSSGMEQTSSEEIVVAAIDNAAGGCEAAPTTEAVVDPTELVHAQSVHQAVVAAAREVGDRGIQRRVVMVGNTAHLVTIHPAAATTGPVGTDSAPLQPPPPDSLDLRVKEELLSVVTDRQPDHTGPDNQQPPIETELEATEGTQGTDTSGAQTNQENNGVNTVTMIDMSDFRNSEPTYQTLTSVNGRMTPPGYIHGQYATLTPLQPVTPGSLPPISSIQMGEKFTYSPIVSSANVSGSFTVMQNNSLAQISLASPYSYDTKLVAMGMSPPHYSQNGQMLHASLHHQQHSPGTLSPTPYHQNGLHSPHKPLSPNPYDYTSRGNLDPQSPHDLSPNSSNLDNEQSPTSDANPHTTYSNPTYTTTLLTSSNNPSLNGMSSVSPHTISPHHSPSLPSAGSHHHHRELSPPSPQSIPHPSPILPPTTILHHSIPQHHTSLNPGLKSPNSSTSSNGEIEEINTKELAQRISAELKRYSIPQAIFAQRVLCRSQGTLSDLLRNPKPWSKLKSGRETFRRMFKWLQEPEFQRMSALRLAGRKKFSTFSSFSVEDFPLRLLIPMQPFNFSN